MGFFDKLKRSAEGTEEKPIPEKTEKKTKEAKSKAEKIKVKPAASTKTAAVAKKAEAENVEPRPAMAKREEPITEGELAIDVYETNENFVIRSTIAGVKSEDLDITIENDIVTIKGSRKKQTEEETKKYYYQECYWGEFSRQVILPEEVDGSKAEASIKDGILTLKIPKVIRVQKRKIAIRQEE